MARRVTKADVGIWVACDVTLMILIAYWYILATMPMGMRVGMP